MEFEVNFQDFIDEAEEQIHILNDGLLALEKNKENHDIIDEVFRAAHTLKGGSGMVGFVKITELTHHLESIFDLVRDKKMLLTSSHLDVMFEVLDVLMALMGEAESGQFSTDIQAVSRKLKTILDDVQGGKEQKDAKPVATKEKTENKPKAPKVKENKEKGGLALSYLGAKLPSEQERQLKLLIENGEPVYGLEVFISDACDVMSLFMFMTFHKIREMGELIGSNPTEEELSSDEIKHVKVLFSSIVPLEDIKKELDMPEVEKIEVVLLSEEGGDSEQTVPQSEPEEAVKEPAVKEESEPHPEEATPETDSSTAQSLVVKEGAKRTGSSTLRVDSEKIDSLLNLAGELIINKARFIQNQTDLEKLFGRQAKVNELKESVVTLMRISNEIQEGIMQLRMVAIDQVFSRFPRVVRDISRKLNKEINLVIEGKETELDKSVVEEIGDPLMHLVRNAVDHGIETVEGRRESKKSEVGTIILRAYHQGSNIVIEIQDDGKGIDVEAVRLKAVEKGIVSQEDAKNMSDRDAVNLIFLPGFSTTKQVSDLSGRGVGMDVVKKNVERLNGVVDIITEKGKGSTFTIKLPLTLAIISTLLTRVKQSVYAIPLVNVIEIVEISRKEISKIARKEAIRIRNEVINILRMDEVFALGDDNRKRDKVQVVIIGVAEQRVGFVVDDLIGEQDIVIKLLDNNLVECPGIAGASILGDGSVALIVDVSTLVEKVVQGLY